MEMRKPDAAARVGLARGGGGVGGDLVVLQWRID